MMREQNQKSKSFLPQIGHLNGTNTSRTYVSVELTSKHGRMFVVRTIELYNISPPCCKSVGFNEFDDGAGWNITSWPPTFSVEVKASMVLLVQPVRGVDLCCQ